MYVSNAKILYESVPVHVLKHLVGHHVCDTSQLFHLLSRQKGGIKAEAMTATSVKDVVCNLLGEKGSLALFFMKKYLFCKILAVLQSKIFMITVENIDRNRLINVSLAF